MGETPTQPGSEPRTRRVNLGGAVILALVFAAVGMPITSVLLREGMTFGKALIAIFLFALLPALAILGWIERDAERTLRASEARRGRFRRVERLLDGQPLPFPCEPEEFEGVLAGELQALPAWVLDELARLRVSVRAEDRRDGEPHVLGLYERRPIATGVWGGATVDFEVAITLYRLPLIRHAGSGAALPDAVRDTLLHEVGHAFGMSEADLDRFTIGNEPRADALPVHPREAPAG